MKAKSIHMGKEPERPNEVFVLEGHQPYTTGRDRETQLYNNWVVLSTTNQDISSRKLFQLTQWKNANVDSDKFVEAYECPLDRGVCNNTWLGFSDIRWGRTFYAAKVLELTYGDEDES